ncbi:MAG: PQQ-binding-like beta-propeller repeat protein [Proteobacteria bacterium]|nr:PQQ-binding-like beta-propeller repeat protein [Pseudomonadota bacterium]
MRLLVLAALLAGSAEARDMRFPDPQPFTPREASYPGAFDKAPIPHWDTVLPGPTVNAATHTERSRPVVEGGHIYVGSAGGEALFVLSRRDGALVRELRADASVEAEPVVSGGRVYFADTGGTTWCYGTDGELVWRQPSTAPVLVRPTLSDGVIYVTNVADQAVAYDAESGTVLWRFEQPKDLTRDAELALYAAPPAMVDQGRVLLGFSDGTIVALEADGGDLLWSQRIGEGRYPDIVAPVVANGSDVYASGYLAPLVAFVPDTRSVRWRLDVGAAAAPLLHVDGDATILYHPGTDGVLRAVDTRTGDVQWEWDSLTSGALTEPIWTEAGLLVGSSDGTLYLVDPTTGTEAWRYHEPAQLDGLSASPVVTGRQLVFVTNAGHIYSMRAPRGRLPWLHAKR